MGGRSLDGKATLWTYIKNYKFNSIFIKNFLVVLFLLMVPLACVHYLVYQYNDSAMRREVSRSSLSELTRIRDTVDIIINEAESLSIRLGTVSDVDLFLRSERLDYPLDYSTIERIRRIQDLLRISILTNPYVSSIQLYFAKTDYLVSETNAGSLDKYRYEWWYHDYLATKDTHKFWIRTIDSPQDEEPEVVLFRLLPVSGANQEGLMTVSVGAKQLEPLMKGMTPEQEIYIVDRQGQIVFTHDPTRIHQSIGNYHPEWDADRFDRTFSHVTRNRDGRSTVVSAVPSRGRDWTFLSAIPLERYESSQNRLRSFIALLIVTGVVTSLIIAFLISVKTYRPIHSILSLLANNLPAQRDNEKNTAGALNELKYIAAAIVQSSEQKKEMEQELERRYELMSKAQSIALQAQINPHMLYNTLEAVNWKVMRLTGGKNEASSMIHALSRLLRLSLSTGNNVIPLRTEIEHARLYVEVQQMHYKDELEVIWKINESIFDYLTVRLTLQPIIENAIYHGIKPSGRPGVITITGYEDTRSVILRIKDNGVGIGFLQAERINQSFGSDQIKEADHIGLMNVNRRIGLIFGKGCGLKISGKEGEGTIVELRLPKQI